MGIYDRDYMKRPRDERDGPAYTDSGTDRVEQRVANFLERHARGLWLAGIALAVLFALTLVAAIIARLRH